MGGVKSSLSDPDVVPYVVVTYKLIDKFSNPLAFLFLISILE